MDRTTGRGAYRAARDMLVRHRDDYDAAVAAFHWPDVGNRFNWALDWFDPIAVGNPRTALRIIDEEGPTAHIRSPRCPSDPVGSPHRWPRPVSPEVIASWSSGQSGRVVGYPRRSPARFGGSTCGLAKMLVRQAIW
jgi:hypothetical protein